MAEDTAVQTSTEGASEVASTPEKHSLPIIRKGIKTANDFNNLMTALMGDLIEGSIPPQVGNAVNKSGTNIIKMLEMGFKYASTPNGHERRNLTLTPGENGHTIDGEKQ